MSFTTMTMFAPRIWGFDFTTPQARVALQSGWGRADLLWEALMEAGNAGFAEGDGTRARRAFARAHLVSRLAFPRRDPRRATALAAMGALARAEGQDRRAARLLVRAARHWRAHAAPAVAAMEIAPRARSSLFHLRMEARHRTTYHANMRLRLGRIVTEVEEALAAMAAGHAPGCRLYARWKGERPNVHDDTRKLMGACLLIPDAGPGSRGI